MAAITQQPDVDIRGHIQRDTATMTLKTILESQQRVKLSDTDVADIGGTLLAFIEALCEEEDGAGSSS